MGHKANWSSLEPVANGVQNMPERRAADEKCMPHVMVASRRHENKYTNGSSEKGNGKP